ncbi:hypothetical protein LX36DRAFT_325788 [Colletotrichum falcatum]|nr:hypothetical protein LX36DRAFT_325788 [Colletotrichum falcatum]
MPTSTCAVLSVLRSWSPQYTPPDCSTYDEHSFPRLCEFSAEQYRCRLAETYTCPETYALYASAIPFSPEGDVLSATRHMTTPERTAASFRTVEDGSRNSNLGLGDVDSLPWSQATPGAANSRPTAGLKLNSRYKPPLSEVCNQPAGAGSS